MAIDNKTTSVETQTQDSLNTSVETQTQDFIFGGLEDLQELKMQSSLYDLYDVSILNELSSSMEEDREGLLVNNFTDDSSFPKSGSSPLLLVNSSPTSSLIRTNSCRVGDTHLTSNVFMEDTERLCPHKADESLASLKVEILSASPQCEGEGVCRIDSLTTSRQDLESKRHYLTDDDELSEDTQEERWPFKKKQRSTKKCGRAWSLDVNPITFVRRCRHCGTDKTPLWRLGPMGPKTLCNACGVRYRSGRLVPEYRPVASPTFDCKRHSNSYKKIVKMTRNRSVTCY